VEQGGPARLRVGWFLRRLWHTSVEDRELFWYAETAEQIWQGIVDWNQRHGTPLLVPGCGP